MEGRFLNLYPMLVVRRMPYKHYPVYQLFFKNKPGSYIPQVIFDESIVQCNTILIRPAGRKTPGAMHHLLQVLKFFKKHTQSTHEKSKKMTGVTLRSTWITCAMFIFVMVQEPVLPPGRLSLKKCMHITWIGLPGRWGKTHSPLCIIRDPTKQPGITSSSILHE